MALDATFRVCSRQSSELGWGEECFTSASIFVCGVKLLITLTEGEQILAYLACSSSVVVICCAITVRIAQLSLIHTFHVRQFRKDHTNAMQPTFLVPHWVMSVDPATSLPF